MRLSFKAHYYEIKPKSQHVNIKTDNNPYLGEKPYLVYKRNDRNKSYELPMKKNGEFFEAGFYFTGSTDSVKYHIDYKDTNKTDSKNNDDYAVDLEKLTQSACAYNRIRHKQPLINPIKKGTAKGKVFFKDSFWYDDITKINEPSILVTKELQVLTISNPNIKGVLLMGFDVDTLAHSSSALRAGTDMSASVFDMKTAEKLKKYYGKYAQITAGSDFLKIDEIENFQNEKTKEIPKIVIPKMRYVNKILTSDEYEKDTVGAKAYNLRRLETLVKQGKIDVKIPKSIALPYAFIEEKLNDPENFYELMKELILLMEKEGINTKKVMVRSAFNGEDLPNYSAAGLYESVPSKKEPSNLFDSIEYVKDSKFNSDAVNSRKKYGIKDEDIKPTVLIQNRIEPDYEFTLYTQDGENNVRIELKESPYFHKTVSPYVFIYNKNTGVLKQESIQEIQPSVTFDEDFKMIDESLLYDPIGESYEKYEKLLKKLVKNALTIEKEFGAPQDIEGGFLNDGIYLWQTRNIVN